MSKRMNREGTYINRKDGRVQVDVKIDGKKYSVYGKTRKIARDKLNDLIALHDRQLIQDRKLTVGQWLVRWMDEYKRDIKKSTKRSYLQIINLHLMPDLGHVKLHELSMAQVRNMINSKTEISPRYVGYIRDVLRNALNDAMTSEVIDRNVAARVKVPSQRRDIPSPWSIDEIKTFLKGTEGFRLEGLFNLALLTGLRQGELLGLRWSDVNLEEGKLYVRQALSHIDGEWIFGTPKSKTSNRQIFLNKDAVKTLSMHRNRQWEERVSSPMWNEDYDLVFSTHAGTPLDASNVRRELKNIIKKTQLPKQRFHDLRHDCANLLAASGATLLETSRWLGHSQVGITANLYSHIFDESLRKASDSMGDLLSA